VGRVLVVVLVAVNPLAEVALVAAVLEGTLLLATSIAVALEGLLVELAWVLVVPDGWAGRADWLWVEAAVWVVAVGVELVDLVQVADDPVSVLVALPFTAGILVEDALEDSWVALTNDLGWCDHCNRNAVLATWTAVLVAIEAGARGGMLWWGTGKSSAGKAWLKKKEMEWSNKK
jgi:hypothetical protein